MSDEIDRKSGKFSQLGAYLTVKWTKAVEWRSSRQLQAVAGRCRRIKPKISFLLRDVDTEHINVILQYFGAHVFILTFNWLW